MKKVLVAMAVAATVLGVGLYVSRPVWPTTVAMDKPILPQSIDRPILPPAV